MVQARSRFPVWRTLWWGYRYAFVHFGFVFRAGDLLLVLLAVFVATQAIAVFLPNTGIAFLLRRLPYSDLGVLLAPIVAAHIAIAWHQAILLGEVKPFHHRWGRPELVYLFIFSAFVFVLIEVAVFTDRVLGSLFDGDVRNVSRVLDLLVIAIPTSLVLAVLPAVAISDRRMKLDTAWRAWRGNRFRYVLFIVLLWLSMGLIVGVLGSVGQLLIRWGIEGSLPSFTGLLPGEGLTGEGSIVFFFRFFDALPQSVTAIWLLLVGVFLFFSMLLFVLGGVAAALSIAYMWVAETAHRDDPEYDPRAGLRDRLASRK